MDKVLVLIEITQVRCDLPSTYSGLFLGPPSQAVSLQDLALAFPASLLKSSAEPGEGLGTTQDGDI